MLTMVCYMPILLYCIHLFNSTILRNILQGPKRSNLHRIVDKNSLLKATDRYCIGSWFVVELPELQHVCIFMLDRTNRFVVHDVLLSVFLVDLLLQYKMGRSTHSSLDVSASLGLLQYWCVCAQYWCVSTHQYWGRPNEAKRGQRGQNEANEAKQGQRGQNV